MSIIIDRRELEHLIVRRVHQNAMNVAHFPEERVRVGEAWIEAIDQIVNDGKEVILACLNQDYRGTPFGISDRLLAMADNVIHLKAVCLACGAKDAATKTFRTSTSEDQVEIGGSDKYQALCRKCWVARTKALSRTFPAAIAG